MKSGVASGIVDHEEWLRIALLWSMAMEKKQSLILREGVAKGTICEKGMKATLPQPTNSSTSRHIIITIKTFQKLGINNAKPKKKKKIRVRCCQLMMEKP